MPPSLSTACGHQVALKLYCTYVHVFVCMYVYHVCKGVVTYIYCIIVHNTQVSRQSEADEEVQFLMAEVSRQACRLEVW